MCHGVVHGEIGVPPKLLSLLVVPVLDHSTVWDVVHVGGGKRLNVFTLKHDLNLEARVSNFGIYNKK